MKFTSALLVQAGLFLGLLCSVTMAQKTVISFDEDKRIPVKISNTSMNRITIEGDRIREVIGVPEQVAVEKDSQNGHMFLKVPEGSHDKLDITVITESEQAQDLTLQPVEKDSTTLVLQMPGAEHTSGPSSSKSHFHKTSHRSSAFQETENMAPSVMLSNTPYQDALIQLMKILFLGSFEPENTSCSPRTAQSGPSVTFSINFNRGFSRDGFVGEIYEVYHTSEESITIQERDFYKIDDLALVLDRKTLEKGQKANLYVIRKG